MTESTNQKKAEREKMVDAITRARFVKVKENSFSHCDIERTCWQKIDILFTKAESETREWMSVIVSYSMMLCCFPKRARTLESGLSPKRSTSNGRESLWQERWCSRRIKVSNRCGPIHCPIDMSKPTKGNIFNFSLQTGDKIHKFHVTSYEDFIAWIEKIDQTLAARRWFSFIQDHWTLPLSFLVNI